MMGWAKPGRASSFESVTQQQPPDRLYASWPEGQPCLMARVLRKPAGGLDKCYSVDMCCVHPAAGQAEIAACLLLWQMDEAIGGLHLGELHRKPHRRPRCGCTVFVSCCAF